MSFSPSNFVLICVCFFVVCNGQLQNSNADIRRQTENPGGIQNARWFSDGNRHLSDVPGGPVVDRGTGESFMGSFENSGDSHRESTNSIPRVYRDHRSEYVKPVKTQENEFFCDADLQSEEEYYDDDNESGDDEFQLYEYDPSYDEPNSDEDYPISKPIDKSFDKDLSELCTNLKENHDIDNVNPAYIPGKIHNFEPQYNPLPIEKSYLYLLLHPLFENFGPVKEKSQINIFKHLPYAYLKQRRVIEIPNPKPIDNNFKSSRSNLRVDINKDKVILNPVNKNPPVFNTYKKHGPKSWFMKL